MTATGQFLLEEATNLWHSVPLLRNARAFGCFRRANTAQEWKDEPGGLFHRESTAAGGSTEWTDPEQADHLSPFRSPGMTALCSKLGSDTVLN